MGQKEPSDYARRTEKSSATLWLKMRRPTWRCTRRSAADGRSRVNANALDGPPDQVVVRILAQAIFATVRAGAGSDLGERNLGMTATSGGACAGTLMVEVRAIAVEPADEALVGSASKKNRD
jgi:hypothetical protein